MHEYTASLHWQRDGQTFTDNRYSRQHRIRFDGGVELPASSSPLVVRLPWSDPAAVDPEEMFVASLSSCHMLWFLSLAAAQGYCIDRYDDAAVGTMDRDEQGRLAMTRVLLRPQVVCSGDRQPGEAALLALHEHAHRECFIANSVRSEVICQPRHAAAD
ncbi:MAG: peroxiredoxin [Xanthomonadaceae bacterium]|nr:peroxiredoxin [Xanthomonadaceae bacterium]